MAVGIQPKKLVRRCAKNNVDDGVGLKCISGLSQVDRGSVQHTGARHRQSRVPRLEYYGGDEICAGRAPLDHDVGRLVALQEEAVALKSIFKASGEWVI